MIEIIGTELYQWDTGRTVQITGIDVDKVHFANQGDSKAVKMDVAEGVAKIPDYLFQTGKQLCVYAVKDGVTIASKTFSVKKRERPEDYVYEEDQRNYIYELIHSAEEAAGSANIAAEEAGQAAQEATNAAGTANNATKAANQAASSAVAAAETANQAAINANKTAKSLMVVGKASGTSIHLDDAIDQFLVGGRIFGKTTQNGTPTPDAPIDLVSVGDGGSITVNVSGNNDVQSMTVATPNGLPGIPVASGGNYTDANGQQWICDEIDFNRGVYVQRIESVDLGSLTWLLYKDSVFYSTDAIMPGRGSVNIDTGLLCSIYAPDTKASDWQYVSNNCVLLRKGAAAPNFYAVCIKDTRYTTEEEFKNAAMGVRLYYILATPIETPLSEDEIAAFNALRTYRGNTTVSNDASAHMEIEYVMDAKKYIDSLVTGTLVPARVE